MALDGGGGGGGPVGTANAFTGTAQALEIYGDFGAAYTGLHAANTTGFTVLSFTSGNYLFVGEFQLNGAINATVPSDIIHTNAIIKLNGTAVSLITTGNAAIDAPMSETQTLLIPAYTQVTVEFDMISTSVDKFASGSLIGRIYR
jgi:hypothetical protein